MVELVYTSVSKTGAVRHVSSTLTLGTIGEKMEDKESESHIDRSSKSVDKIVADFLDGFICVSTFSYERKDDEKE